MTVVGLTNPPAYAHPRQLPLRPQHRQLLGLLVTDGELAPDFGDEIVAGTCVVRAGAPVHGPTAEGLGRRSNAGFGIEGDELMSTGILEYLTVFVLAAFVGIEVINAVPSILHTPLMSGSNAIHGIVLVGPS